MLGCNLLSEIKFKKQRWHHLISWCKKKCLHHVLIEFNLTIMISGKDNIYYLNKFSNMPLLVITYIYIYIYKEKKKDRKDSNYKG